MMGWDGERFTPPKWENAVPTVEQYLSEHENRSPGEQIACTSGDVPWHVQEFMFEEIAPIKALDLADFVLNNADVIIEMARERLEEGYALYGSRAFNWTAEERLRNVVEELSDAVVYLCTGRLP